MAQAGPLTPVPSIKRSLPFPCAAMSPLVSAPIPPLNIALVVRLRSSITTVSSSCLPLPTSSVACNYSQCLVQYPLIHTLTYCSSVAHMTAGLLCSTSELLELQVLELIAVVNVVYHLFNSPLGLVHSIDDVTSSFKLTRTSMTQTVPVYVLP